MAEFVIRFGAGEDIIQREIDLEKQIWDIHQRISQVNRTIPLSMKLRQAPWLNGQMQQVMGQLDLEKQKLNAMHCAMDDIVKNYRKVEQTISGAAWKGITKDTPIGQYKTEIKPINTNVSDMDDSTFGDFLKNLMGSLGIGSIFSAVAEWADGNFLKGSKEFSKVIGFGASGIVNSKGGWTIDWKKLFDIKDSGKYNIEDEFSSFFFDKKKTGAEAVGNKINVVAKWAEKLLIVGNDFCGNYVEHDGAGNARFWQEFSTETAIDLGKDFIAGSLASSAAAGIIGAVTAAATAPAWIGPVLGTAASIGIAVTLDWGLDYVTKLVTGDSEAEFTEVVSDVIWDKIVPGVKSAGEHIVNAFGDGINAMKNWFSKPKWAF